MPELAPAPLPFNPRRPIADRRHGQAHNFTTILCTMGREESIRNVEATADRHCLARGGPGRRAFGRARTARDRERAAAARARGQRRRRRSSAAGRLGIAAGGRVHGERPHLCRPISIAPAAEPRAALLLVPGLRPDGKDDRRLVDLAVILAARPLRRAGAGHRQPAGAAGERREHPADRRRARLSRDLRRPDRQRRSRRRDPWGSPPFSIPSAPRCWPRCRAGWPVGSTSWWRSAATTTSRRW